MSNPIQAFFRFLTSTTSTNDVAKELFPSRYPPPIVVIAETQTNGRGRFGRTWKSQSKNNFYGSFGFALKDNFASIQLLPIWIAHHLCKDLNDTFQLSLQTKWPNDIVFQQKKVAGILLESTLTRHKITHLIVGIGLNINTTADEFPPELQSKATSLKIITQSPLEKDAVVRTITKSTLQSYDTFFSQDHSDFPKLWQSLEHTFQKQLKITLEDKELSSKVTGLTPEGHLVLSHPQTGATLLTLRPDQISPFDGYTLS